MKRILLWIAGLLLVAVVAVGVFIGPTMVRFMKVTQVPVDANLTVFLGGGGNSIVLKSEDSRQILIVDTKMGEAAKKLKQYVDALNPAASLVVVNTHAHKDHTEGNRYYPNAMVITGSSPEAPALKNALQAKREFIQPGNEKTLTIGSETVIIRNLGRAHSFSDSVVYLVRHKMLVTGDLVFNHWNPVLKKESADTVKWVRALDDLIRNYQPLSVVPGHGDLTDQGGLMAMRDYFTSITLAVDDPTRINLLRKQYQAYACVPGMSSFDRTLRFIAAEKKKTVQ